MNEIIERYGLYILIGIAAVIFIAVSTFINNKKRKGNAESYFSEHPDAAKIYISAKSHITQEELHIINIDNEIPVSFQENGKNVVYALPGERTLFLSYTYTRPGVMYKSVSKSTGNVERTVTVEANKSYLLGYDRKNEEFTFEETEA